MLDSWLPKGAPFFEYLSEQNRILCSLCALLPRSIAEGQATEAEMNEEAIKLEEEGDAVYTTLITKLSQTFITPIDREDILRIGKEQENTIDLLRNLVARLYVFKIHTWPYPMEKITQNLSSMVALTGPMLAGLAEKRTIRKMKMFRELRNECETLISYGLGEALNGSGTTHEDTLNTLKLTRAYDRLEQALFQIVELGEAIEEAVLKNV